MRRLGWKLSEWPVGIALWLFARTVAATSRTTITGERPVGPAVYVSWHQRMPYLCEHHGRRKRWLIASPATHLTPVRRCGELLGLRLALGTSGDGGARALEVLEEAVKEGGSAGFAVDGPAGPARKAKPGAARLASRCSVPVVPITYRSTRSFVFSRRWDQMDFPMPFSTIEILYGAPIAPEALTEAELCARIEAGLSALEPNPT